MAKISTLIVLLPQLLCIMVQGQLSLNNECGVTSYYFDDTNSQIVNGEQPFAGQWPWLVALFVLIPDELVNEFQCTGSIVSTKHIVTGMLRDRRKKYDITNILRASSNARYLCYICIPWSKFH